MMAQSLAKIEADQAQIPWPDSAGKGIALKRK
jgi:hypothetical protein